MADIRITKILLVEQVRRQLISTVERSVPARNKFISYKGQSCRDALFCRHLPDICAVLIPWFSKASPQSSHRQLSVSLKFHACSQHSTFRKK